MSFFKRKKEKKPEVSYANPHVIEIENFSRDIESFVLFGSSRFLNEHNFGNSDDIKISYLSDDITYSSFLTQMLSTSYKFGLMRVQSNNKDNLRKTLYHNLFNPNVEMFGVVFERRDIKLATMIDAYQFQMDILDVRLPNLKMDKHHYFSGYIEPQSTLVISFFPTEMISSDFSENVKFGNARLSGVNVAPVIIHTTPKLKRMLEGGKTFFNKLKSLFKRKNK